MLDQMVRFIFQTALPITSAGGGEVDGDASVPGSQEVQEVVRRLHGTGGTGTSQIKEIQVE
jgi:hypothetical protein